MFIGFYDGERQVLSYSNAGHHPPLVIGADGARALERGGLPLGMFPDSSYERQATTLVPGDLIVLFTDGVIEAPDERDQEFGEQRLIAALEENRQQPLEALSRIILDRLKDWGGHAEAHDDVTLVLARVR